MFFIKKMFFIVEDCLRVRQFFRYNSIYKDVCKLEIMKSLNNLTNNFLLIRKSYFCYPNFLTISKQAIIK